MIGVGIPVLWILVGVVGPWLAPYSPTATNVTPEAVPPFPPSAEHWLGTDQLGRDLLTRILYGLRTSIVVGVVVRTLVMVAGGVLGILAAMSTRWIAAAIMRMADVVLAVPALLVAMGVTAALGPSLSTLVLALVITGWPEVTRIVYGEALSIKERDFIMASRMMGARAPRIYARHVVPNMARLLGVAWSIGIPGAIMYEAGLSYFGFGIQPPAASLGSLIAEGQDYATVAPWFLVAPTVVLMVLVVSFNVAGDVLGRAGDQKTSHLQ